jgi:hypothetical protein
MKKGRGSRALFLDRPVMADAVAVVGGEQRSSLYRLLIKRTRPIGVSLR